MTITVVLVLVAGMVIVAVVLLAMDRPDRKP